MSRLRFYSTVCLLFFAVVAGFSQPGGGRNPHGGGPCPNPPCNPVPITGIEILVGIGGLLGIRASLKKKKPL